MSCILHTPQRWSSREDPSVILLAGQCTAGGGLVALGWRANLLRSAFQNEEFAQTPPKSVTARVTCILLRICVLFSLTGHAMSFVGTNGKRGAEALSVKINVQAETPQLDGVNTLINSMEDKRTELAMSAIDQDAHMSGTRIG